MIILSETNGELVLGDTDAAIITAIILAETNGELVFGESLVEDSIPPVVVDGFTMAEANGELVLGESRTELSPPVIVESVIGIVLSETSGELVLGDTAEIISSNSVTSFDSTPVSSYVLELSTLSATTATVEFDDVIQGQLFGTFNGRALSGIIKLSDTSYRFDVPYGYAKPGDDATLVFTDDTGVITVDVEVGLPTGWSYVERTTPAYFVTNGIQSGDIIIWNDNRVVITENSDDYIYLVGLEAGDSFRVGVLDQSSGFAPATIGTVTLQAVNRAVALLATPPPIAIIEGDSGQVDLSFYVSDPDLGAVLSYSTSNLPTGFTVTSAGLLEYEDVEELASTVFYVDVTDGEFVTPIPITIQVTGAVAPITGSIDTTLSTSTFAGSTTFTLRAFALRLQDSVLTGDTTLVIYGSMSFIIDNLRLSGVISIIDSTPGATDVEVDNFLLRYPYFATTNTDVISFTLQDVSCDISRCRFPPGACGDNQYARVVYARTAHELIIRQQLVSGQTTVGGQITSQTVDKTSFSLNVAQMNSMTDEYFMQTKYGQQYLVLVRQYAGASLFTAR